jgi:chemotaxis protein methyltransferase CheR
MSLSQEDLAFVRGLVYRRSAIVLDEDKNYLIETRLSQLARDAGFATPSDVVHAVQAGKPGIDVRLIESITTHETSFFRDVHPFEALRTSVLPSLIEARQATRTLTIWSAASSFGQEAYSIAMMLRDKFPQLAGWNSLVFGTDLSHQAVARAGHGRFHQLEVNRGLPAAYTVKYFKKEGLEFSVAPEVRSMTKFQQMNLLDPWHLPRRPDVIFLRNVLIYFDVATKRAILEKARRALAADGALFLGAAETTLQIDEDGWSRVQLDRCSYYRPRGEGAR